MMRFLLGVAIGGVATYWYLTGQIPWRDEVLAWFSRTASSYTSQNRRSEADRIVNETGPARAPR
ncbi:MAG TPA: hypothetical protein VFD92_12735 [Candidatus Binatia bacterium]|nr:hypothetical protein [Candidatus Binatia bacterium]